MSTKPWPRTRCPADHRDLLPQANLIVLNFLPFKFGARQRPLRARARNRSKELRVKIRCRPPRSSQMGSPAHLAMKARHCILGLSIPRVSSKAQRVSLPRQKILWVLQFYWPLPAELKFAISRNLGFVTKIFTQFFDRDMAPKNVKQSIGLNDFTSRGVQPTDIEFF